MTLPDVADLLYGDGLYADPAKVTRLARFYHNSVSASVQASRVVKTNPGLLIQFVVSSISAQFIQLFDAAALPTDGAVPTLVFPIAATSVLPVSFLPVPYGFENGLVICNSSTQHTKTIGSADCLFNVQFI